MGKEPPAGLGVQGVQGVQGVGTCLFVVLHDCLVRWRALVWMKWRLLRRRL